MKKGEAGDSRERWWVGKRLSFREEELKKDVGGREPEELGRCKKKKSTKRGWHRAAPYNQ